MSDVVLETASKRAARTGNDDFLLTPGPLTTSLSVKQAMLRDWGSRDPAFIDLNADIRDRLSAIANSGVDYVCVPVQGSGTFAIEATLGTLVPPDGKLLVLVNGAYGERMMKIMRYLGRDAIALTCSENETHDPGEIQSTLAGDDAISHVAAVHCETTSGILNPIEQIADKVHAEGRALIIDAMSSFGALPLDAEALQRRGRGRVLQQMPRGRARHRLRDHPKGRAPGFRGQQPLPGARPLRSMEGDGGQRPVALHPADPCHGRLSPSTGRARSRRRRPRQIPAVRGLTAKF